MNKEPKAKAHIYFSILWDLEILREDPVAVG